MEFGVYVSGFVGKEEEERHVPGTLLVIAVGVACNLPRVPSLRELGGVDTLAVLKEKLGTRVPADLNNVAPGACRDDDA